MPRTVISLDEVIRVTGSANPFRAMGSVTFRFRFADASSISALLSFVGGSIADRLKRSLSAAMPDIMQEADISVGAPSAWSNTAGLDEAKITVVMPVAAVARTLALVSADGLINIDRIYGDNQDYPVEVVGSHSGLQPGWHTGRDAASGSRPYPTDAVRPPPHGPGGGPPQLQDSPRAPRGGRGSPATSHGVRRRRRGPKGHPEGHPGEGGPRSASSSPGNAKTGAQRAHSRHPAASALPGG